MKKVDPPSEIRSALGGRNLPEELFRIWEEEGVRTLLPLQAKAIAQGALDGKSLIVIGPTSCGKTFVGELIALMHALGMRRSLYLVPSKALAEEKYADFQRKYARPEVGAQVVISTGDRRDGDRRLSDGDYNIAILTYEKLSALLVFHPTILSGVGALIVDEIQMISDETRGAELELLLTRVKQVSPDLQVIGLSAVVSELRGLDEWLGAEAVIDDHRPVPLREGAITPSGRFEYAEWTASQRTIGGETLFQLRGNDEEELAVSLVCGILKDANEQVLIFVNTVPLTQRVATMIAAGSSLSPAPRAKKAIASLEQTESVERLNTTLDHAVAFHNADLTMEERLAVEDGFRSGEIRCLVSTSTLSMGVNLPASTVVIARPTKWTRDRAGQWAQAPITVGEYRNMSGRAGRFGLRSDDFGRSILISRSPLDQQGMMKEYVNGKPLPLESAFLGQPLDVRILRIFASGLCSTLAALQGFLLRTFGATHVWNTPAAIAALGNELDGAVRGLQSDRLIVVGASGEIKATQLGLVCASSGLSTGTFRDFVQYVMSGNTSGVDVALLASVSPDAGVTFRFSFAEYQARTASMIAQLGEMCQTINSPLTETVLGRPSLSYEEAKSLKYVMAAVAYLSGTATRTIERTASMPAGRIRSIGSMCSWLAETAARIAWVTARKEQAVAMETLSSRYAHGCSEKALLLTQVPYRMHRADREAIVNARFDTLQKIIDVKAVEIARKAQVSLGYVQGLQRAIGELLGPCLELEKQQVARMAATGQSPRPIEELYTATGTVLEQVIDEILKPPFCPLTVSRITPQREGEADLKIVLSNGRHGIVGVSAKENPAEKVGMLKAGSVLQQSPELNPQVFIFFGRPDFDATAIRKASAHVAAGKNYKIIPIAVLAEMVVRYHEERLTSDRVREILEDETGYVSLDRL